MNGALFHTKRPNLAPDGYDGRVTAMKDGDSVRDADPTGAITDPGE